MKQIKCEGCGAPINWDGCSEVVSCPYCGMRYQMRQAGPAGSQVLSDGIGRGTVAQIPCIMQGAGGACFLSTYVPSGWRIQCGGSAQGYGDPARDGAHITTTMAAPGDRAFIVLRSGQTVRHVEPSILNGNGQRHLNLAGATVVGGGGLEGTERTAAEYDDEMLPVIFPGVQLQLLGEENADEEEQAFERQLVAMYRSQGADPKVDWKRRYYLAQLPDGKRMNAAAETRIVSYDMPGMGGSNITQELASRSGFAGLLGKGLKRMHDALTPRFWEVQYELLFLAEPDIAREVYQEFLKVRKSFQFLPAFEQFKARERQTVLQCQQQMMADRAASQQRMMNTMQETQNYIHGVQSDMIRSNAASHDRVAAGWSDYMRNSGPGSYGGPAGYGSVDSMDRVRNMWSEAIKETNTYYGNDGKIYEASTAYDHIYQGNENQDSFIGTEGTTWDPGVSYDDLKRTDGRY